MKQSGSSKTFTFLLLVLSCLLTYSFKESEETFRINKYNMKNAGLNSKGELVITASITSAPSDFDFLLGAHNVQHQKLKNRLTGSTEWETFRGTHKMELLLKGFGNLEQHFISSSEGEMEGIALRLFNPVTRLWSIDWSSSISGKLDVPMVGSFENKTGFFYARDHFKGQPILVQFKWDATNENMPVWSQAFSVDNGNTWEWNWHMRFSKLKLDTTAVTEMQTDSTIQIGVIELRNYVIKHGLRDSFMHYFEENFIEPQEVLNGYLLGQYRVKGLEDNFCWIRGFKDMRVRSSFLPAFYYGPVWKQHKAVANSMLANNDNVYLLQPLSLIGDTLVAKPISRSALLPGNRIAVVDFYISNTKLDRLLQLFAKKYLPLIKQCDVQNMTLWTSVVEENDFPKLPVFQDKNLLVTITFYKNELEYAETMKKIESKTSDDLRSSLQDLTTIKSTMFLYPTDKAINEK